MTSPRQNVLKDKSYAFALRTINLYKHLAERKREYIVSKQVLRSGTSIGANIAEANQAQSRADFISKLSIALKEAVETEYWLNLLRDARYLTKKEADSILFDCEELIRILTAIIKKTKLRRP
ncbi:MAG: four helix bundle protein [Acidobacteriota bacterium]